jgi:hypothetical protein
MNSLQGLDKLYLIPFAFTYGWFPILYAFLDTPDKQAEDSSKQNH